MTKISQSSSATSQSPVTTPTVQMSPSKPVENPTKLSEKSDSPANSTTSSARSTLGTSTVPASRTFLNSSGTTEPAKPSPATRPAIPTSYVEEGKKRDEKKSEEKREKRKKKDPSNTAQSAQKVGLVTGEFTKLNKLNALRQSESMQRDETPLLSSFPLSDAEVARSKGNLFAPTKDFDFAKFRSLQNSIQALSGTVDFTATKPEVVLLGINGGGKSHLLEAIIGEPLNLVEFKQNGSTKRPLFIHLVSGEVEKKLSYEGRDSTSGLGGASSKGMTPSASISDQSSPKNLTRSPSQVNRFISDPVSVQCESKWNFNVTLIDTPGLPPYTEISENQEYLTFIEYLIRPPHRQIILVEDCMISAFDHNLLTFGTELNYEGGIKKTFFPGVDSLREVVLKCDPSGSRTVIVNNKLLPTIQHFKSPNDLQRFVNGYVSDFGQKKREKIFFTSLLSSKEREATISQKKKELFVERLMQMEHHEKSVLRSLQCPTDFYQQIGIDNLRAFVMKQAWNHYQRAIIPSIHRSIQKKKNEINEKTKKIEDLFGPQGLNLKTLVSRYASQYTQLATEVINGTARANPNAVGETLKEEVDDFSSSEWRINDIISSVPLATVRLYGGQQFERLFSEFLALCERLVVPSKLLNSLPLKYEKQFYFHACEVAKDRSEDTIIPLIDQLHERIMSIFKRIPDLVETLIKKNKDQYPIDMKYFRQLNTYLRTNIFAFAEKLVEDSKKKCMSEFYPTKTIMWEALNMTQDGQDPVESLSEKDLVCEIFARIKQRIAENVIRKMHNFFLIPILNSDLWLELQTTISCMDPASIGEVLDASLIREELDHSKEELGSTKKKITDSENFIKNLRF
eukprot:TRINITY_DN479_c2_g2_i1.p1 TRINITY_DN479_c2_g2~~TRINITY_DN479_c2_g2_i1.p1  ORF type:complete len:852 (+),score=371.04 TRINITY_DN479_c2_g2_i1:149-2704(+)